MSLTSADFEGFDLDASQRYLKTFDSRTRKKGESYFRSGAVSDVECEEPGRNYAATVQGSEPYRVLLDYDDGWDAECSCPVGYECKHVYATVKQLLAEHSAAAVVELSGMARKSFPIPKVPGPKPTTLADQIREKLGRKLTSDESRYLGNVSQLYRKAVNGGGLYYPHELTGLGLPQSNNYWERLELYLSRPRSEQEFWNYLALYLTEKRQRPIPEFLEPLTDLTEVRERMRRHQRGKEITRWSQTLAGYAQTGDDTTSGVTEPAAAGPIELRLRFTRAQMVFEWRTTGGEWAEIKSRKVREFESKYAAQLLPEAALLWLPYWQRTQTSYSPSLNYGDQWTDEQIGRWFRQPMLRPLFADEQGGPLVFHDTPVRWNIVQPDDTDGDYAFSLGQASGEPLPKVWLVTATRPAFCLTPLGVFTGPQFDPHLTSLNNTTLIPAKAFESAGGLRLLERLKIEPPPRLAARVHTATLRPGVRAEIKTPWAGQETEYCYVEVYGASQDGEHVEHWTGTGWSLQTTPPPARRNNELLRMDRTALAALLPPLDQAGFKWDYHSHRWQLRLTKKFAETFVTFLRALPAEARIDLGGELASFQNAEVAGKIRLEAREDGMDWFNLQVLVDVNDVTLTQAEIKLLLDAKGNWVRLDNKGWRKLEFTLSKEEDEELARLGLTPGVIAGDGQFVAEDQ